MKTLELEKPLEWTELGIQPVETIAQEARRVLALIPEERWCVGTRTDSTGRSCALGHYSLINYKHDGLWCLQGPKVEELIRASNDFCEFNSCNIAAANNGWMPEYQQPTPKQRTIAFLDDMIKAGF